jgi:hypothetical protein
MRNWVTSVTETVDVASDGTRTYMSSLNWNHELDGGERVFGPMTLFNKGLYYSVFQYGTAGACQENNTSIYGVDYITPSVKGDPTKPGLLLDPSFPLVQNGQVVAGVAVRQLPSCSSSSASGGSDDFLGYGAMTQSVTTSPGDVQLVFFAGGTQSALSVPGTQTVKLKSPMFPARISSWAPIVE